MAEDQTARFPFVQFEFTHSIGPPAGRYTVYPLGDRAPAAAAPAAAEISLDDDGPGGGDGDTLDALPALGLGAADVVAIKIVGAPPPSKRIFRSGLPPKAAGAAPREMSVTLVTAVLGTRVLADMVTARKRFSAVRGSQSEQSAWVAQGFELVGRCVAAYRAAAADPYVADLSPLDARSVRIGYGPGSVVVRHGWEEAVAIAPPRPPKLGRTARLMPMQAMAAMLSGTGRVLEAEELILRVSRDLEQRRPRAAAVALDAAQVLLLGELAGEELAPEANARLERVAATRARTAELARRAQEDRLTEADIAELAELAEETGAAVDTWRYAPLGYV